jgi:hypothetical protein
MARGTVEVNCRLSAGLLRNSAPRRGMTGRPRGTSPRYFDVPDSTHREEVDHDGDAQQDHPGADDQVGRPFTAEADIQRERAERRVAEARLAQATILAQYTPLISP